VANPDEISAPSRGCRPKLTTVPQRERVRAHRLKNKRPMLAAYSTATKAIKKRMSHGLSNAGERGIASVALDRADGMRLGKRASMPEASSCKAIDATTKHRNAVADI